MYSYILLNSVKANETKCIQMKIRNECQINFLNNYCLKLLFRPLHLFT